MRISDWSSDVCSSDLLSRLELHFTAKHASWLNMAEIEIGVLTGQCLDRRIDNRPRHEREIAAWQAQRNATGARVKWMFPTDYARAKIGRAYPKPGLDQAGQESDSMSGETRRPVGHCL